MDASIIVKSTFEMDGLFTQEDIDNRHYCMKQCNECNKWTKQDSREKWDRPCENCGGLKWNLKATCSLRTFNPSKKKLTRKQEKASGQ